MIRRYRKNILFKVRKFERRVIEKFEQIMKEDKELFRKRKIEGSWWVVEVNVLQTN